MRHVFVVNPVSGKEGAGRAMVPLIEQAAADCGILPEFVFTEWARHGVELAGRYAAEAAPVRLYAVGGDGTLNELFSGAHPFGADGQCEVAAVPCGSGNDFVRSFGKVEDFLDLRALLLGSSIPIDLMRVDGLPGGAHDPTVPQGVVPPEPGGVCAAITSTGLDAEVAFNIPKYRRIPLLGGTMAYNISILEKLLKPLGKTLRITIDGKVQEGKYLIATVCNGQTYGGGYRAAPMAKLDDGILNVILVKKVSRLLIAKIIGTYKKGAHYRDGAIIPEFLDFMQYATAREVVIQPTGQEPFILNVDGECGPAPRLYAKVMPKATRFVLPKPLYETYIKG